MNTEITYHKLEDTQNVSVFFLRRTAGFASYNKSSEDILKLQIESLEGNHANENNLFQYVHGIEVPKVNPEMLPSSKKITI